MHSSVAAVVAESSDTGLSPEMVRKQLDRIRSAALQMADSVEILRGNSPTTAEIRAEWREMKRRGY